MASGPITLWQIDGETTDVVRDYLGWGGGTPKSLQMVTVVMKLNNAFSSDVKV